MNINDVVKVRLTAAGLDLLAAYEDDIDQMIRQRVPDYEVTRKLPDSSGYHKFQLWTLMSIFAAGMELGRESPFENGIIEVNNEA